MNPKIIKQLRELEAKATPDPWEWGTLRTSNDRDLIVAMRNHLPELLDAASVSCAICKDTRELQDAGAWDCGQANSACPYCPDQVQELLADLDKWKTRAKTAEINVSSLEHGRDYWKAAALEMARDVVELSEHHLQDCEQEHLTLKQASKARKLLEDEENG